jgi:hypothetical protein
MHVPVTNDGGEGVPDDEDGGVVHLLVVVEGSLHKSQSKNIKRS